MPIGLKDSLKIARSEKEQEIVRVLLQRPDLTYEAIGELFGVSEWPIKRIVQKYRMPRRPGRKAKKTTPGGGNGLQGA
jgi:DNA-directed RNA polymerase specialized sigma subunit